MKVISNLSQTSQLSHKTVLVIGVFDGVHIGHRYLIQKAIDRAKELELPCAVMTFDPHPVQVLRPQENILLLSSIEHRLLLFQDMGVDIGFVVPFSKEFADQSPEDFVKDYLVNGLNVDEVFVGDDFRFGQNRSGTIEVFENLGKRFGFAVHHLKVVGGLFEGSDHEMHKRVSSSAIRQHILEGDLFSANKFLGRPVSIYSEVRQGDGRGKGLGYPTINLIPQNELLPPNGVYAVRVKIGDKKFSGMANIGLRPSVSDSKDVTVEVHLFDFDQNLYGQKVIVEFIEKIRDERKFSNLEELQAQIQKDEEIIRKKI